jgi:hypothetical protein
VEYEKREIANRMTSDQLGEASSAKDDIEAFGRAISLQAAARAARYANRPPLAGDARQAIRELDLQERLSRLRPFKLVLEVFIGAAIFAGIMCYTLGIDFRLPFPSTSALPDTSLLQPPRTPVTTKPLLR